MKKLLFTAFFVSIFSFSFGQLTLHIINVVEPCNNDGSMEASISGGVPPYQISWYYNNVYLDSNSIINNLSAGYYQLIVNNFGVTYYANIYLRDTFFFSLSITSNGVCPTGNGILTGTVYSGIAPYNFMWSNGQQFLNQSSNVSVISNLTTGYYSLSVSDSNGCTSHIDTSGSINGSFVNNVSPFTLTISNTLSNCNDGTATVHLSGGGVPPYVYFWNSNPIQTTSTANGLPGNISFKAIVSDSNGCMASQYTYISIGPMVIQETSSITNSPCGYNIGSITSIPINGQPPYSYLWSTGDTTQTVFNLSPGGYTVTVTDFAGCSNTFKKYIYSVPSMSITASVIPSNCNNSGGSASVNVSGGNLPYYYFWSSGLTSISSTATNLSAGYYTVVVTDLNGCSVGESFYIPYDPACLTTVSGRVYADLNNNCIHDPVEYGGNHIINLGNGNFQSTSSGYYYYSSPSTFNYSITCNPGPLWIVTCPTMPYSISLLAGQSSSSNDFAIAPTSSQNDVVINTYYKIVRPGFNHTRYFTIYNKGNTYLSGTVEIIHDSLETLVSSQGLTNYNSTTRTMTYY